MYTTCNGISKTLIPTGSFRWHARCLVLLAVLSRLRPVVGTLVLPICIAPCARQDLTTAEAAAVQMCVLMRSVRCPELCSCSILLCSCSCGLDSLLSALKTVANAEKVPRVKHLARVGSARCEPIRRGSAEHCCAVEIQRQEPEWGWNRGYPLCGPGSACT